MVHKINTKSTGWSTLLFDEQRHLQITLSIRHQLKQLAVECLPIVRSGKRSKKKKKEGKHANDQEKEVSKKMQDLENAIDQEKKTSFKILLFFFYKLPPQLL